MSFDKTSEAESREHQKQERREEEARRRAALAADPRVQAMKEALKDRHAPTLRSGSIERSAACRRARRYDAQLPADPMDEDLTRNWTLSAGDPGKRILRADRGPAHESWRVRRPCVRRPCARGAAASARPRAPWRASALQVAWSSLRSVSIALTGRPPRHTPQRSQLGAVQRAGTRARARTRARRLAESKGFSTRAFGTWSRNWLALAVKAPPVSRTMRSD